MKTVKTAQNYWRENLLQFIFELKCEKTKQKKIYIEQQNIKLTIYGTFERTNYLWNKLLTHNFKTHAVIVIIIIAKSASSTTNCHNNVFNFAYSWNRQTINPSAAYSLKTISESDSTRVFNSIPWCQLKYIQKYIHIYISWIVQTS